MARWEGFKPFRGWLENELDRRDWRPIDLARRINPEYPANVASSISKWMSGKRQPDTASCAVIADILGADLDTVLELAGHKPKREGDELIDSIAASLRALPREQVEYISTSVRALHDDLVRRRAEAGSGSQSDTGSGEKRTPATSKPRKSGKGTGSSLGMAPIELIVGMLHGGASAPLFGASA